MTHTHCRLGLWMTDWGGYMARWLNGLILKNCCIYGGQIEMDISQREVEGRRRGSALEMDKIGTLLQRNKE